jgi:transposase
MLLSYDVLEALHGLVQDFASMLRKQETENLDSWITRCMSSGFKACRHFPTSLLQDYEAVRAAFSLDWSNGQTEGQVHRLKLPKRQMYGRAKLDLLRIRLCYIPT